MAIDLIQKTVRTLSALAQESRVRIFRLLVEYGESGMAAGDIAQHLESPQNSISFHLKEMVHASILGSRREGRKIYYFVQMESIDELITFLLSNCCKMVDSTSLQCSQMLSSIQRGSLCNGQ